MYDMDGGQVDYILFQLSDKILAHSQSSSWPSRSPPKSPPPPGAPPDSWYTLEMIGEQVSCTSLSFSSKSSFSASWLSSSHPMTSSRAFSMVSLSSSPILSATPFSESPSVFFIEYT